MWPIYMAALRGDFRSWLVASVMPTYFLFLSLGRLRRRPRWLKWTRVLLVVLIAAVVVIVTLLPPGVTRNAAGERSALEQQNNDAAGR